jgi:hypothetical protein
MIRYFSSRELSGLLHIPLNRWKRWTREFLPPDPLGGLQSGYARQLSVREAFTVYLGGFLVSAHGFSMPQARLVLQDLSAWIKKHIVDGQFLAQPGPGGGGGRSGRRFEIHIQKPAAGRGSGKLTYRIREIFARSPGGANSPGRHTETYAETELGSESTTDDSAYPPVRCLLEITMLADRFACLTKR